jgi:hypothetical protein
VQLCVFRPDNPITFLRQYFQKLERVSSHEFHFIQYLLDFYDTNVTCCCMYGVGSETDIVIRKDYNNLSRSFIADESSFIHDMIDTNYLGI